MIPRTITEKEPIMNVAKRMIVTATMSATAVVGVGVIGAHAAPAAHSTAAAKSHHGKHHRAYHKRCPNGSHVAHFEDGSRTCVVSDGHGNWHRADHSGWQRVHGKWVNVHPGKSEDSYNFNCKRDGNKKCAPGYRGDGYVNHHR